ncbi:MarR family transcriptional regulator [Mycobacterium sp. MS1601]|uniref:MarR family winged helix-turn-helix transcriptional regulator n=1 Tax=Mycobacterium sp. MS1601 TaxID=1936029 RepID=UPI0009797D19|nr:MarR family winged helix-turn-helix transcriptional regulator [Mycobacterium sp. MS1601]AQA03815.1 MarR family transcriptional regulator [Mycobacterium sp. MS1601]
MTARAQLEGLLAADVRALSAESEQIGRTFAGMHDLSATDFRALVHVLVADDAGDPLTAGELRRRMGLTGGAITYLVERMIASGHLRRESDPTDRRKVILRYDEHGLAVGRDFFTPLSEHTRAALAELPESDLAAAHRVFTALVAAMREFQAGLTAD